MSETHICGVCGRKQKEPCMSLDQNYCQICWEKVADELIEKGFLEKKWDGKLGESEVQSYKEKYKIIKRG